MIDTYQGNISTRYGMYIEDFNGEWVDFSDKLISNPSITSALENSFNNFYSTINEILVKNDDGFWDKPFPEDMKTLSGATAVWSSGKYFSVNTLLQGGKTFRIQFFKEVTYPNTVKNIVLGTYYIKDLTTDLSNTAKISLVSPQKLLMDEKIDTIKAGTFWYQFAPTWFLMDQITKKIFGEVINNRIILPDSYNIPREYYVNLDLTESKVSLLGRPPVLLDTDNDGYPDGVADFSGIPRCQVAVGNYLIIAVDSTLWRFDTETLLYKSLYTFNSTSEYTQIISDLYIIDDTLLITVEKEYSNEFRYWPMYSERIPTRSIDHQGFVRNFSYFASRNISSNILSELDIYEIFSENQIDTKFYQVLFGDFIGNINDIKYMEEFGFKDKDLEYVLPNQDSHDIVIPFKQRIVFLNYMLHESSVSSTPVAENPADAASVPTMHILEQSKEINADTPALIHDVVTGTGVNIESNFQYEINNGIFSFLYHTYYNAVDIKSRNVLKYTVGQVGIHKFFKSKANYFQVSLGIENRLVTENAYHKSIHYYYQQFYPNQQKTSFEIPTPILMIKKYSDLKGTLISELKMRLFRYINNLNVTCISNFETDEFSYLAVREHGDVGAFRYNLFDIQSAGVIHTKYKLNRNFKNATSLFNPNVPVFEESNCSRILKLYNDPFNSSGNIVATLSTDSNNNKDESYWVQYLIDGGNGLSDAQTALSYYVTPGSIPRDVNKSWWLLLPPGHTDFETGELLSCQYVISSEDRLRQVCNFSYQLTDGTNTLFSWKDTSLLYAKGDLRGYRAYLIAETIMEFKYFEILEMVNISSSQLVILTFNKKSINTDNPPYCIQVVDITNSNQFPESITNKYPLDSAIATKTFYSKVSNLTVKDSRLYYTVENEGLIGCWDSVNGFKTLNNGKAYSSTESYFSKNLSVISAPTNPEQSKIFGLGAPYVNDLFLLKSRIGNNLLWCLDTKLYAVTELADFENMNAMDALKLLASSMFYTLGIDKFGNLKLIKRNLGVNTTKSITKKIYSNIETRYGLSDIYNQVSVVPFKTTLQNPTWNISSLIRDDDYQLKLKLDLIPKTNKPLNLRLLCIEEGFVAESSTDNTIETTYKLRGASNNQIVLDLKQSDEEDLIIPILNSGSIVYEYKEYTKNSIFKRIITGDSKTKWILSGTFYYDNKSYNEDGYVVLSSTIDTIKATDLLEEIRVTSSQSSPLFSLVSLGSGVIEVVNTALINKTDTTIYLSSVFGGQNTENGVKPGYYIKLEDEETKLVIYKKIIAVDSSNNSIQIESGMGIDVPINVPFKIYEISESIKSYDILELTDNKIVLEDNSRLTVNSIIKFFDNTTQSYLNERYKVIKVFTDRYGKVLYANISPTPSGLNISDYSVSIFMNFALLNTYYDVFNYGLSINVQAEFPSFPEQRYFKKGESITIELPGLKLEQDSTNKQTVVNLKSIEKYGLKEYPAYSENKFLNANLARAQASLLLNEFAFPKYTVNITNLSIEDIDFFNGEDLYILEIQNERKFPYSPEFKEKIYLKKITRKGRFVNIEGRSILPYEY